MVTYITRNGMEIVPLAKMARKHRLFVSGWILNMQLRHWIQHPEFIDVNDTVSIAYDGSAPIGIGVLIKNSPYVKGDHAMVFVRKSRRRQGIGTHLINNVISENPSYVFDYGSRESFGFWDSIRGC